MAEAAVLERLDELTDHEPGCECWRTTPPEMCGVPAAYMAVCRDCNKQLGLMCKPHGDDLIRCFWMVYSCSMCRTKGLFNDIVRVVTL